MATRHHVARGHGHFSVIVPFPGIRHLTPVLGSITELGSGNIPFVGAASVEIRNLAPLDNSVHLWVTVDHPHDLNVRITLVSF